MPDTHIKMPDVIPLVRYAANGTQNEFNFPFPIFASEDIAVYLDGALQVSGYTVDGAGQTDGGTVTFADAPIADVVVAIERRLPIERMTDFLEGGDLSARSLNNELDFLIAGLQQVARDQSGMLRYNLLEDPGSIVLPSRESRAGRALAFDGDGDLTTVAHGNTLATPSYTQTGTGAVLRSLSDRAKDVVSIKDFGAVGDGLVDDTTAIQNALAAHTSVFVPTGTYRTSGTIVLGENQTLFGTGQDCVIAADDDDFNVIEMRDQYAALLNLRITGGDTAVKLYGVDGPCVQNTVRDVVIEAPKTGLLLDGHNDTDKPCYWNNFINVLIDAPTIEGIRLTKSGAGDTPNANRFNLCRVYSHGTPMTGSGVYVEYGSHANSFTDCEFNVHGDASACVRLGAHANKTFLVNVYTESYNVVPNVKLDAGSLDSTIVNLHAMSNGSAIWDLSGGEYTAINAGYPNRNTLAKTTVSDLNAALLRMDTVFVDAPGTATIDVTIARTVHLVAATNGPIT
ncbi:MAG TPA: glycosyl hydrolase family 28-related protein, partial [Alphaproteobacteria bacterium]